jgi:hypothetical protein
MPANAACRGFSLDWEGAIAKRVEQSRSGTFVLELQSLPSLFTAYTVFVSIKLMGVGCYHLEIPVRDILAV